MAISARCKSAAVTTSGEMVATGVVAHALHFRSTASAGTIVLKDGGSGGTTKLTLHTPALAEGDQIQIPGGGMSFPTNLYAALTDVDGLTVFYTDD